MCGLFGMAGPGINQKDLAFIKDLAYVSGLRGLDGTGICQGWVGPRRQDVFVEKSASDISLFLLQQKHSNGKPRALNSIMDNFFIGHVRAATIGEINDNNAHPFSFPNLIGVHNGTLVDHKYQHKHLTNSELMFRDMNERGIVPVLSELDPQSAYAVVVFDKTTGELHFAHNDKRPLIFATNAVRSVIYWASEAAMLTLCARRNGVVLEKCWHFNTETLYTINPQDVEKVSVKWERTKIQKKEEPKEERKADRKVVPLIPPRDDKKTRRFRTSCLLCDKEMTLVDQYFAEEVGTSGLICAECDSDRKIIDSNSFPMPAIVRH